LVFYSIPPRPGAPPPHAGELGAGGTVNVKKKGTVFNVTRTVQS
ncbi:MAG: multiubiquitin domain-containing protein, partial [Pseudolabrys sp.]|nr:multiubiquitin domain-containing protein [Pseudolabrys sp.]